MKSWMTTLGAGAVLAVVAGCSSSKPAGDPLLSIADRALSARARAEAVGPARELAQTDPTRAATTRRVLKDIVWTVSEPQQLRMEALGALLDDPDPTVQAESREMVKLLIAKEKNLAVLIYLCRVCVDRGWTDAVPSLVRSYARSVESIGWIGGVSEEERPEREAIVKLSGGRDVEAVAFETFLNPPSAERTYGVDWTERTRVDAWDLLARLDRDGERRLRMIEAMPEDAGEAGGGAVAHIRRSVRDLRAMPLTGEELRWVGSLLDPGKPANAQWWEQASRAIQALPDVGLLHVRHAEVVRWASATRPEWLGASRGELLATLRDRLKGRTMHQREIESGQYRVRERLEHWGPKLSWADLLTVLVIDEVVRQPSVVRAVASQAVLDRRDTTTEYGGALLRKNLGLGEVVREEWVAVLYPPRPGQRQGDQRFVASDDMIAASDLALAHYHLHAQRERNGEYAGPSPGDLAYAARSGRACVVFTSVGSGGRLNVDYYQPDGAVIDLGEVVPPPVETDSGMTRGVGPR
jgi:hypothetical protein